MKARAMAGHVRRVGAGRRKINRSLGILLTKRRLQSLRRKLRRRAESPRIRLNSYLIGQRKLDCQEEDQRCTQIAT